MGRGWLVCVVLMLTACGTATPPAPPVDPNLKTLDFAPTRAADNFLLKSDGSGFLDLNVQRLAQLTMNIDNQTYTTHLGLRWSKRFNPNNQVKFYLLTVTLGGLIDSSHTFSDNRPTVFVEVDGQDLTAPLIEVRNRKNDTPPRLEIILSDRAVQRIIQAKTKVAVKAQLKSDRIARSNVCANGTNRVDDYLDCRFSYTGRSLTGAELSRLQALLKEAP